MLCSRCHVQTDRDFPYCLHCGSPRRVRRATPLPPLELVQAGGGGEGIPLVLDATVIGRDSDADVVLTDPAASRRHALIRRDRVTYSISDLGSANGTWVRSERVLAPRVLAEGDDIKIGNTVLRARQPRPEGIGGRTEAHLAATTVFVGTRVLARGATAPDPAAGPLDRRPRRRSGWAEKRLAGSGDATYTLANVRTGQYLRLTDRDHALWSLIDGERTVREILYADAAANGVLAMGRLQTLLTQLRACGLVAMDGDDLRPGAEVSRLRRGGRRVVSALMRLELAVSGIDGTVGTLYRRGGWRFFTRSGLLIVMLLAALGIPAFVHAFSRVRLFDVGGVGILGVVVTLVGYVGALTIHELAHALATKSYGRRVTRGGLMVMLGMPFAFVDTSDMWFEGRRGPRIVVSLAGPLATAALAGAMALGAATLPAGVWPGICFHVAFGLYVNTLFNFNPLIPLDGYYVLMDLTGRPRLREEAMAYFRRGIWQDLAARRLPGRDDLLLAAYGMVALVATFAFIGLAVVTWRRRLGPVISEHVAPPWDTVLLGAGCLVILFPLWFVPASRLWRRLSRTRATRSRPATAPV